MWCVLLFQWWPRCSVAAAGPHCILVAKMYGSVEGRGSSAKRTSEKHRSSTEPASWRDFILISTGYSRFFQLLHNEHGDYLFCSNRV